MADGPGVFGFALSPQWEGRPGAKIAELFSGLLHRALAALAWAFRLAPAARPPLVARSLRVRMWGLMWENRGRRCDAECG
jgi:hypothetical protein